MYDRTLANEVFIGKGRKGGGREGKGKGREGREGKGSEGKGRPIFATSLGQYSFLGSSDPLVLRSCDPVGTVAGIARRAVGCIRLFKDGIQAC